MNNIFKPYLRKFVIVFFDDILVYSRSEKEHTHHLATTLQILMDNEFYLKESKCHFGQQRIEYLGHIVTVNGVQPDPSKI